MPAPPPNLIGDDNSTAVKVAIVRNSDNRVIDIVASSGGVYTQAYPESVTTVYLTPEESCQLYWIYDEFNSPRFYSDATSYEDSIIVPITVIPGSLAIGNDPGLSNRGYYIKFPDETRQTSAVYKESTTTFTALQEFTAGISSGQIIATDPIDGAGIISTKGLIGAPSRIGAIRLGYASSSASYNTFLENSSGTFTIYNGFSATGSNLLNINTASLQVNVPVNGFNFSSGITAPNIVYSINGCTGYIGITGTENEITVTGPCPNIVIGLPNDVTISGSLTVNGDIYIDGGTF